MQIMKKLFFTLILACMVLTLPAQEKIVVDGILSVVGREIIMRSDLEKAYMEYTSQLVDVDDMESLKCEVLENMLMRKLFLHQAELDSISVTAQQVDDNVNARISYLVQQIGGDPKVIEQFYGKSMDEIKSDMREFIREQLIVEQIQQAITDKITITPSEVKKFYDNVSYDSLPMVQGTYEYGHIVKVPPVSDDEIDALKVRLEEFRERILRGEKFSMLARLYSDDPGSASKGGNLGFVERGTLYPEVEAVAFKLKTGEISQVFKSKAGYHIVQLIERRGESVNIAHILLQPKPSIDEQVKAIEYLDSIRIVIKNDKINFSDAAIKYSDDANKNSGGWVINPYTGSSKFDKETLEPTTLAVLDKLIPGEYSEPLPYVNDDGVMAYRLIYLKTKVPPHKPNLVEDYDLIQNAALEEKKYKEIDKWLSNKVKVTSIKVAEDYKYCPFITEWEIP